MRRAWLTGLVLLGLGLLTSCGPPIRDLAAVHKDDSGRIMVELGQCGGSGRIVGVHAAGLPDDGGQVSWSPGREADQPGPFPLFAPPGAGNGEGGRDGPQSLESRSTYIVAFEVLDGHRVLYRSSTEFRRTDIEGLRPDQVWANGKAMSRKKYRAYVKDEC
ncbi:hypothetical protein [Streptomyces sp. NPDC059957]|uniref:hypothetical protein n=1 Tax=Streptomyces sp. NPDC059957 TaxID=3347016 RepID=UPI0036699AA4